MRAKKVDDNQRELVKAFRDLGATVLILSSVGSGCPDLLIGYRNKNFLVEIKDGKKWKSQTRLTIDEQEFFDTWNGQVVIIDSIDSLVDFMNRIT